MQSTDLALQLIKPGGAKVVFLHKADAFDTVRLFADSVDTLRRNYNQRLQNIENE